MLEATREFQIEQKGVIVVRAYGQKLELPIQHYSTGTVRYDTEPSQDFAHPAREPGTHPWDVGSSYCRPYY
jgi:hypothetical protein